MPNDKKIPYIKPGEVWRFSQSGSQTSANLKKAQQVVALQQQKKEEKDEQKK